MKRLDECLDPEYDASAMLEALLDSTPDAIKAIDNHGRITAFNERMVALWSLPPELQADRSETRWGQFIASQLVDPDAYLQRNARLRHDRSQQARDFVLHRDGRAFERICMPQRLGGQVVGTVVYWRDVTAQHHGETWRSARDAAEQASRAKSAFVGSMSHELRTPLSGVLGLSELMLLDPQALAPDQRRRLSMIHDAGRHMLQLLDDLLDMSRIEAGEIVLRPEPLALQPLVAEVLAQSETLAMPRAITLTSNVGAEVPSVLVADRLRLKQVLLNLVSNAIKYNRDRGAVVLNLRAEGSTVQIEVVDTGAGLTPLQQAALFQPFDRLGQERGGVQGTGLGLVIARALVECMGGRLTVDSCPGVGSRFSVALPQGAAPGSGLSDRPLPLG